MADLPPSTMHALDYEDAVERFHGPLYRFALSLARNEDDACDLVQQTFVVLLTKGHQLRDPSKLKTWLFTTLFREFTASRRRSYRFSRQSFEDENQEWQAVAPTVVDQLDAKNVLNALHQVDEVFRAPLSLFYLEDHSYKEIAEILGVPIGTVMSRIARGKKQIRSALALESAEQASKIVRFSPSEKRGNYG